MLPPICSMLASKMIKMVSTKYASQHTQSTLGMLNCIKGMLISTPVTPVSIQGMLDRIQSMLVSTVRTLSMLVSIPHMLNYTLINVVSIASMLIAIRVCKELLPCLLCVRKIRTVFLLTSIHSMLTHHPWVCTISREAMNNIKILCSDTKFPLDRDIHLRSFPSHYTTH